jgi:ATP-dependent DNA helicase RecQ
MRDIHSILKEYWGYSAFRPLQEDIINTVLNGNDCLALLPTGGGKSICFQVPAMALNGLCLVITPLIALMKDQVENLRKKGITSFAIHSGMNRNEVLTTMETAGNSNCKFLYVSPERLETRIFKEYLPSLGVKLIAVDEAHCISQWGYDFRPSYLRIASLREELPGIPVLALTASATVEVQNDICDKLLFQKKIVFRQSFARPNLSYSVFSVAAKINKIEEVLSKVPGTGIVYCRSRRKTKEISDLLNMKGISADYYHAGLPQEERNEKQEAWLKDRTRIIVCTNAFGMGIDKPGVRTVIHVDVPDCLENYYQEAGRAGRDGKKSYAVLLTNHSEVTALNDEVATKFPAEEEIRSSYRGLMNHLQIPAGTGEGNYYELDIQKFVNLFQLDTRKAISALKILEQEELLYFNEQVFIQSRVQVIASRQRLIDFENEQPELEILLKHLLRSYEGILDHQVNINEKSVSFVLKKPVEVIIEHLNKLHNYHIIDYAPKKEKPQVYLYQNRVKSDDLKIDTRKYNKRKKQYEERLKAMQEYVESATDCRSVMIGKYFGDEELQPCGICDNCVNNKKKELNNVEFSQLGQMIIDEIRSKPISFAALNEKLKNIPTHKIKEVVKFLQSEEEITVNDTGELCLKNAPFSATTSQS